MEWMLKRRFIIRAAQRPGGDRVVNDFIVKESDSDEDEREDGSFLWFDVEL